MAEFFPSPKKIRSEYNLYQSYFIINKLVSLSIYLHTPRPFSYIGMYYVHTSIWLYAESIYCHGVHSQCVLSHCIVYCVSLRTFLCFLFAGRRSEKNEKEIHSHEMRGISAKTCVFVAQTMAMAHRIAVVVYSCLILLLFFFLSFFRWKKMCLHILGISSIHKLVGAANIIASCYMPGRHSINKMLMMY